MRAGSKPALVSMLMIATGWGCNESHSPCGADGAYVAGESADYCVYALSSPIVIEGGFSCPVTMSFSMDVGAHRVCSDHQLERGALPAGVCVRVGSACSEEAPAVPGMAQPGEPRPMSDPEAAGMMSAGTGEDASGPIVTWTGQCPENGVLETGLTGDRCSESSAGCGTTDSCVADFALCDPGDILQRSQLNILDCSAGETLPSEPAPRVWSGVDDCKDALHEGRSFQPCDGPFVCAEHTADPCCVQYALCVPTGTPQEQRLVRYEFCELGCTRIDPILELAPATRCDAFAAMGGDVSTRANYPCEGDFLCWNDQDLSGAGSTEVDATGPSVLRWCSEGVVRGQKSTLSNAFALSPFSP